MYKKILSDFSAGSNYACAPLQLGLDSKVTPWAHGLNVEIFSEKGVCRQKGNIKIAQSADGKGICAVYTYTPAKNILAKKILYVTSGGGFYEYDVLSGEHKCLKSGLDPSGHFIFAEFIGGIAVSNAKDAPFFYKGNVNGLAGSVCDMKTVAKDGVSPIFASAMCAYKSRLWLAADDTLYFSALGTFDDWTSIDDAGYISNFHCDAAPITALRPYMDYLAIYKRAQTYLLSGNSGDNFAVVPFADKGANNQNAVVTAGNKQYFFSNALFSLEQSGILSQISLGSEATLAIKPMLNDETMYLRGVKGGDGATYAVATPLDKSSLHKIYLLPYEPKNQLWLYIPTQNNPHINNIWIFDYIHNAWTLRGTPQPISCAANYGEQIISGTSDGRILLEFTGKSFDGVPIEFEWRTPFLALGNVNTRKEISDFYFLVSDSVDNNFRFCAYKDYDTLDAQDQDSISISNLSNLLWASDANDEFQFFWADDSAEHQQKWAIGCEIAQKVDLSLACTAVQFCVFGSELNEDFAILALECKEITEE